MDLIGRKVVVADAEFDSLDPDYLWCLCVKEWPSGNKKTFRADVEGSFDEMREYAKTVDFWVGHRFNAYDRKYLKKLENVEIRQVIDTLVVSRLVWAGRPGGHSIENLGKNFSLDKKEIICYNRRSLIPEYVERCLGDVEIGYQVFLDLLRFIQDPGWTDSIDLEHKMDLICEEIKENGFSFNSDKATTLLGDITERLNVLTKEIRESVGPVRYLDKTVTFRRKKDKSPDSRSSAYIKNGWFTETNKHGDTFDVYLEREFNPGSPKDRIELLNQSGWKPYIKTDTHRKLESQIKNASRFGKHTSLKDTQRLARLKETGWKVCEENLETLPDDAPEGCVKLAEWLTLEGRRSDLEEWLAEVKEDGKIHPTVFHIGGWTQRCSHTKPNCANIFSEFHGNANSPVKRIKEKYDAVLRSLWEASPDRVLVGTDADGIQLRILAHLMGDQEYIDAVASGDKKKETDVHNVNKRALNLPHLTRDHAKTFIYAFLYGAGDAKIGSVVGGSAKDGRALKQRFLRNTPALEYLRERVTRACSRGHLIGLDGRKLWVRSEHSALNTLLQASGAVVMKKALILLDDAAKELGFDYKFIGNIHDEIQTEVDEQQAEDFGKLAVSCIVQAGQQFGLRCPLDGEYKIGDNWSETH